VPLAGLLRDFGQRPQASTDDLPPMLAPCFEKRHMVDDFVTSDFHPAVRFLVQLHLARGTLTWTDLVKDSAFVLLGQAAQPVIDTLSAINAWCLAQTGDLAADAQDSTFAIDAGFDAASPLASWLTRVRFLAHRKAVAVTRHWFPATATPVSALPTAGVHPLGLSHAAEFRSQPGKPYKDLDCLLHE
jgi:hypothetical protein